MWHHVHARPKLTIPVFSRIKNDLYWNSLDNFHVVARGILGWKQTEEWASCAGDTVHVTS